MMSMISERFLHTYFLLRLMIQGPLDDEDERAMFFTLGRSFYLPEEELNRLYEVTQSRALQEISTEQMYFQHERIRQYLNLKAEVYREDPLEAEILKIKGNALSMIGEHRIRIAEAKTKNAVYCMLSDAADLGWIPAFRCLGFLMCEGIYFDKNPALGLPYIVKSADWNDIAGILLLLREDPEHRDAGLSRLAMAVKDTLYGDLLTEALRKYPGGKLREIPEIRLLEKTFRSGRQKRDMYDPVCARIIYSRSLSFSDRERCVFNDDRLQTSVGDLPLKLTMRKRQLDLQASLEKLPLHREQERAGILRSMKNADLRLHENFKPLCICSDSLYILNMYAGAFAELTGIHTVKICMKDLAAYDLELTSGNVFLRNADEDAENCYLLFLTGDISEMSVRAAEKFLQSKVRSSFCLQNPNVTINLGSILPVCFCDRKNLKAVGQYCQVMETEPVSAEELAPAVSDMIARYRKLYGIPQLEVEPDLSSCFSDMQIDAIDSCLSQVIGEVRTESAAPVLTKASVQSFMQQQRHYDIGFGFGGKRK